MLKTRVKQLLSPTGMGWLAYAITSFVILIGSAKTRLVNQLGIHDSQAQIVALAKQYFNSGLLHTDHNQAISRLIIYILWASVGAVVYLLLWVGANIYVALRNDLVIGTRFTNVGTHGRLKFWIETASRALVQLGAVLLIALLTVVVVQVWYPVSVALFDTWIGSWNIVSYWAMLAVALLGWLVTCHLYVILVRLALLRTRIIPAKTEEG